MTATERREILRKNIILSTNKLELGFIKQDFKIPEQDVVDQTQVTQNQIMVVFKNGRYEVLPRGITGYRIVSYLGPRYRRIIEWTVMPNHERFQVVKQGATNIL
jgi:hypothetical protein